MTKVTNRRSRRLVRLTMTLAVTSVLNLHSYGAHAQTLQEAKADGITIAIANEPPIMKMNPDGSPGGLGPELDAAVFNEVGITKFSAQVMEYGAMIPAIQSRRATMISAGALFIKPERCEAILYSEPVGCNGEAFIVSAALGAKVKTFKDVAEQGLKIGVCGGCSEQKLAREAGVNEENIVVFPDATSGLKLLTDKRIDVFTNDALTAASLSKRQNSGEYSLVRLDNFSFCTGAGFNKDSAELRDAYNEGLRKIRANGKYLEIMKKYDFEEGTRGTDKVTTAQLCDK
ncbi:ectoine/hydroxyectoine ABC transporter substrate-binding protein EhuB [Mesorhizobium sp. M0293]|uniref:ectoine/hydroxyectoine ABC transporter substrate-binding protein EhuB n=1 Tax=Mesorhizobium sp. M0293 TaxID=2956930 RepID=UPI0033353FF5